MANKGHGGKREGAGRKPEGKEPKKQIPAKVSIETRDMVDRGSKKLNISKAKFVEEAISAFYINYLD